MGERRKRKKALQVLNMNYDVPRREIAIQPLNLQVSSREALLSHLDPTIVSYIFQSLPIKLLSKDRDSPNVVSLSLQLSSWGGGACLCCRQEEATGRS